MDLGPEGGDGGGRIVAQGRPEDIAANPASPKPTNWYYAPGSQSIGVATGNETSVGILDNDRVRESAFGFLDGHDPVVRRYDLLSNPVQPQNDNPGNSGAQNSNSPSGPATSVAANDNDGRDYNYCLGQCSELAIPTGDFGVRFRRCMAQCMGTNSFPEWEGVFEYIIFNYHQDFI